MKALITASHSKCTDYLVATHLCDPLSGPVATRLFRKMNDATLLLSDSFRPLVDLNRIEARPTAWRQQLRKLMETHDLLLDVHSFPGDTHFDIGLYMIPGLTPDWLVDHIHGNIQGLIVERIYTHETGGWENDIVVEAASQGLPAILIEVSEQLDPELAATALANAVRGIQLRALNPKRTQSATYAHRDHLSESGIPRELVTVARRHLPRDFEYTIVKWTRADNGISFIHSPDWNSSAEPTVGDAYKVHTDGAIAFTAMTDPPKVYHQKARFNPRKFRPSEVATANATDQTSVFGNRRGVVIRHVMKITRRGYTVLDFGAGKDAADQKHLNRHGRKATAYEFGENVVDGIHDTKALSRTYDVVMASNVLNVQSNKPMLQETIRQLAKATKPGSGQLVVNLPSQPQKMNISNDLVESLLDNHFREVERISGTSGALWVATNRARRNPFDWEAVAAAVPSTEEAITAVWNALPASAVSDDWKIF